MRYSSDLQGVLWWLLDKVVRAPALLVAVLLAVIFVCLITTYPYMFGEPVYLPEGVVVVKNRDIEVGIQYPNHVKTGAAPIPVYITAAITSTAQQPVMISLEANNVMVKVTPREKTLQIGGASNAYSDTQVSIQYLPESLTLLPNREFTLTTKIQLANTLVGEGPALIGIDSLTTRVTAMIAFAGTLVALALGLVRLLGKKAD